MLAILLKEIAANLPAILTALGEILSHLFTKPSTDAKITAVAGTLTKLAETVNAAPNE